MKLRFPEKCHKDDLLMASTIAYHCIEYIRPLCIMEWDDPTNDYSHAAGVLWSCHRKLAALAQHGWGLGPRIRGELALVADGVVEICGVSAVSAHEATFRLADRIGNDLLLEQTMVLPDDFRGHHVDPDAEHVIAFWEALCIPGPERDSIFLECGRCWERRIGHLGSPELEVLERRVQREYYLAKARRSRQKKRSAAKEKMSKITRAEADATVRELARKDATFPGGTSEQWAARIRRRTGKPCSKTFVLGLPFWKETMDETGRGRGKKRSRAAVSLSDRHLEVSHNKEQLTAPEELICREELQSAIRLVMQSALGEKEKKALIQQLHDETRPLEDLAELLECVQDHKRDHEPSPFQEGGMGVKQHKRL